MKQWLVWRFPPLQATSVCALRVSDVQSAQREQVNPNSTCFQLTSGTKQNQTAIKDLSLHFSLFSYFLPSSSHLWKLHQYWDRQQLFQSP